jgi:recombinational DNA repair ATPase RecF
VNPLVNDMLAQFVDFRVDLLPTGELATNRVLSKGEEHIYNIILFLNLYLLYRSKHTIPNVIFIDEFIENLDVQNTEKMLDLIKSFSKDIQIFLTTPRPLPLTENSKILIE